MVRESGTHAGHRAFRRRQRSTLVHALAGCLIAFGAYAGGTDRLEQPNTEGDRVGASQLARSEMAPEAATQDLATATITLSKASSIGADVTMSRQFLSLLCPADDAAGETRKLVAIPDCESAGIEAIVLRGGAREQRLTGALAAELARVEEVARIRDQAVAIVALRPAAFNDERFLGAGWDEAEIELSLTGERGPVSRDAGPFTGVLRRAVLNYGGVGSGWRPHARAGDPARRGSVTPCTSVADCSRARIDFLIVAAGSLSASPTLTSYASHEADYLGLNVGIVSTVSLPELTAPALRAFIRDVYESQSAEHFGDGHLGFVLLVGDAYADNNQSVMIPSYNGYGGSEVASDHYYACVSGDDDLEDLMLGRFSVGNQTELASVVTKAISYMPQVPGELWRDRVLLVAGLFFTLKDHYVSLFDEYDEIIPDTYTVSRIYRHDFGSDQQCATAVVSAVNSGYLFVNYAGDGWISSWYRTLTTSSIASMQNADRLPIVLSMACMTGWFDNTTEVDATGSYDCLAEQLVNAPGKGAIACLAASRSSDGGMFRTLTKKLYQAAFNENCTFIGETIAVAKLLHLEDGGDVTYARHFNLFGDPALIYSSDLAPSGAPDLVVKPYATTWSPEFPGRDESIEIVVRVANDSNVDAGPVLVRATDVWEGGSQTFETQLASIDAWSSEDTKIVVPAAAVVGNHDFQVTVDPGNAIHELREDNNSFSKALYVYPDVDGFPIDLGADAHGLCATPLSGSGKHILVAGESGNVFAIAPNGTLSWQSLPSMGPLDFGREIAPAAGDLNGDGENEILVTKRMGLTALNVDGGELWTASIGDPVGYPLLADVDSNGNLDAIVAVRGFFSTPSKVIAFNASGQAIWSVALASGECTTACPVAGDFNLDGHTDIAYGTSKGVVAAVTSVANQATYLWPPVDFGEYEVSLLALGDIDGDGKLELVVGGDKIHFLNAETGTSAGPDVSLGAPIVSLGMGDTDGDGIAEVIAGTSAGTLHLIDAGSEVWEAPLSGVPGSSVTIADIDADDDAEILTGTDAGYLHVLSCDGQELVAPIPIPGGCGTPFAVDLTGDGKLEVAVVSAEGLLFAFGFEGGNDEPDIEWAGLGRNAGHTGVHVQPLGGTITGDRVLSGTCRVEDSLVVASTGTLVLSAETVLEFGRASSRLQVQGELQVPGHPGADVVLAGGSGPAGGDRWTGIRLDPGASANIASCRISDAAFGIDADKASIALEGCDLSYNVFGARLKGCSLSALGTSFSCSDSVGLYVKGGSGTVENCMLDGNYGAGLDCRESGGHVFRGSSFSDTRNGSGALLYVCSNTMIDSCAFDGNSKDGVFVKNGNPVFSRSSFAANRGTGIQCQKLASPSVSWCTVTGNKLGVCAEAGSYPNLGSDVYALTGYNVITGNSGGAVCNYSNPSQPIYAKRNWWGSAPPNPRMFYGYVIYTPWLTGPPNQATMYDVGIEELPAAFRLLQNTPNPFNPTTTIRFEVPAAGGPVDLSVFDAGGRHVVTLYAGLCGPGSHEVAWDGRDERGEVVASGVYFARMTAPEYTASRKMVLLR
jgi:hypothetical protein